MEDVGNRVLGEFAQRLEQRIGGSGDGSPSPSEGAAESATGTAQPSAGEQRAAPAELDVGALVTRTPAVRVAAALALAVLAWFVLRRRR